MKNPASIPLQGQQGQQGPQGLQIQIPTEEAIQEYNREKEERRQKALERLRNENRALPLEQHEIPFCPSVPRSAPATSWESLGLTKKN
jgi:hypothetical protein